ncbi:hypothetical protein [Brevibacillus sp. NL20B1]|uniref:hypothetical protein n=1 Tax=Brevibacillus sp. NL20B1 TaxID=2829799 RepID=UPI001BA91F36|nr:hypothetical protein [Brevibacillus sp. NL20B1]
MIKIEEEYCMNMNGQTVIFPWDEPMDIDAAALIDEGAIPMDLPEENKEERHKQAQQLAAEILHLEAILKAKKEELKQYVEQNGKVVVGDTQFDFVPSYSWEGNWEALARHIREKGLNPFDFFKLGSTEATKLMKKTGWDEEQMKEHGVFRVMSGKQFRSSKVK